VEKNRVSAVLAEARASVMGLVLAAASLEKAQVQEKPEKATAPIQMRALESRPPPARVAQAVLLPALLPSPASTFVVAARLSICPASDLTAEANPLCLDAPP
jgi:hypothetical protein